MSATIVQRYLRLHSDLKQAREQESALLDGMDLLWQVMTLEERDEIRSMNLSWPPPALTTQENEDDHGKR